jgi:hypothetical protein
MLQFYLHWSDTITIGFYHPLLKELSQILKSIFAYSCFQTGDTYGTLAFASLTISLVGDRRSTSTTKPHQNYYYNEYHEGIIEIANSFLKILSNQVGTYNIYASKNWSKSTQNGYI